MREEGWGNVPVAAGPAAGRQGRGSRGASRGEGAAPSIPSCHSIFLMRFSPVSSQAALLLLVSLAAMFTACFWIEEEMQPPRPTAAAQAASCCPLSYGAFIHLVNRNIPLVQGSSRLDVNHPGPLRLAP